MISLIRRQVTRIGDIKKLTEELSYLVDFGGGRKFVLGGWSGQLLVIAFLARKGIQVGVLEKRRRTS